MENKKWWIKFKNGNTRLVILAIVSYSAGLGMLIVPEKTSDWIIRGVGLVWTMEAISYTLDLYLNYLKKRKESLFINGVVGSYKSKTYADLCKLRKQKIEDLKTLEKVMKDVCAGVGKYTDTGVNYKP